MNVNSESSPAQRVAQKASHLPNSTCCPYSLMLASSLGSCLLYMSVVLAIYNAARCCRLPRRDAVHVMRNIHLWVKSELSFSQPAARRPYLMPMQLFPVLVTTVGDSAILIDDPQFSGYFRSCVYHASVTLESHFFASQSILINSGCSRTLTSLLPPGLYDMTATWNEIYFHPYCFLLNRSQQDLVLDKLEIFFLIWTPVDVRKPSPWTYIDIFDFTLGFVTFRNIQILTSYTTCQKWTVVLRSVRSLIIFKLL